MPKINLTQEFVDTASSKGKNRETFYDTALPGFGFYVLKDTPTGPGKRAYFIRYVDGAGIQRGPYAIADARPVKLKVARELARVQLGKAAGGTDLAAEKSAKRAAFAETRERTLRWVVDRYQDTAEWRDKRPKTKSTDEERLNSLVLPILGDKPVKEITAADVRLMIDQVWKERTPIRAGHARAALSAVLSYAVSMDWVPYNAAAAVKPNTKTKAGERERVLSDREIAAVWNAKDGSRIRDALRLALLCATRRNETITAEWREFDLIAGTWTIPAEHTKMGRVHIVYLSRQALALLQKLWADRPENCAWVFPNRDYSGPIKAETMPEACHRIGRRIGVADDNRFSPHDFRRTATSRLAEMGIANAREVLERMLSHVSDGGSKSFKHYQRYTFAKEVRATLQLWADEVERIAEGRTVVPGANVHILEGARNEREAIPA